MTANDRPWDIHLWMYPGGNPALSAPSWGLDVDITSYVKYPGSEGGQPITYTGGRRGESTQVDPGELTCSVDTKDGVLCADNILSQHYGLLGLGTPVRLGVTSGADTFTRSAGAGLGTSSSGQLWTANSTVFATAGTNATASFASANTATAATLAGAASSDWDITFTAWVPAVATGASLFIGAQQQIDANNYVICGMDFKTGGATDAKIAIANAGVITSLTLVDPLGLTYSAGEKFKIRAMRDGSTLGVKIWKAATSEPAAWSATATNTTIEAGQLGIFGWRVNANTNTSPQFAFDDLTITGIEFTGTLTELPLRWDKSARNSWSPLRASGILRRLRQARTGAVQSPLRHQLPFYNPVAYWPLEDGAKATGGASALAGQQPAKFKKVTPAADTSLAGALQTPTLNAADGSITGFISRAPSGATGFAAMFLTKLQTNPAAKTRLAQIQLSKGAADHIDLSLRYSGGFGETYLDTYDSDGILIANSSSTTSIPDFTTTWTAFCVIAEVSGGNTLYTLLWYYLGDTIAFFNQDTVVSTTTPVARQVVLGGTSFDGASFAHLGVYANTLPFVSSTFFNAATGFDGESASDRINRVASEAGIPVAVEPGTSEACGPQRIARPIEIMQSAADADYGVLYERATGVAFRPRSARRNQPVALTLSVASKHIAEPPEPILDDQRIRNKVIASRDGGSSATAQDDASIDRHGEIEESVSLNVESDDQLQGHAELRKHIGVHSGTRWPSITLDFARNPLIVPSWRTRGYGPRMRITTGRGQVTGNEPDLIAEGHSVDLWPHGWVATLSCSAARIFDTGIWNDPTAGRSKWGPTGATIAAPGISAVTLSIPVDAAGETWRTGAVSYSISVGGEHIPITSVSGPVSGVYTLTASARGANTGGVGKAAAAGAPVTFANPARWGL